MRTAERKRFKLFPLNVVMSKKRLTVVYSAQAMENAREIVNYLQNKFSDREVDKFRRILSDFERIIGLFPSLYPQSTKLMSVGQY